jgi:hypothetical protein
VCVAITRLGFGGGSWLQYRINISLNIFHHDAIHSINLLLSPHRLAYTCLGKRMNSITAPAASTFLVVDRLSKWKVGVVELGILPCLVLGFSR